MEKPTIKVYGAPWCPDCRRSKQFLGEQRVPYQWIDVDQEPEAMRYLEEINGGKQTIPTILFEDGSVLVEPTNAELARKLGIQPKAKRTFYDLIVVGSGPAALTTAIYAAREGMETLVIERADRLKDHAERFGVEILPAQAVASVSSMGDYKLIRTETGDEYCSRALLLATGSHY